MRLLAIDGATERASVGVWSDDVGLYREREAQGGHGDWLLATVRELLDDSGYPLSSFDAIAFGCGPGSFTGLRVVAAVVQGLAFGADLGVIPVSDLEILAQDEAERGDGSILAALDARMGEIYWAAFSARAGQLVRLVDDTVGTPESLILPDSHGQWRAAGNAWTAYGQRFCLRRIVPPAGDVLPSVRCLMRLAIPRYETGAMVPAEVALPVYVRNRVVQSHQAT
ncbi:MAG: tRNA (adenosine(37)-N6)-threonylcarbamoyltransferase complex dimerization subunit type 1 TsaB [Pseudomonadota bacterium]|nr:tRNA (adenosine(37)-N6)-threonylcarbamoyltransferase complex dimerization subunit type 1 TsaB [Pseudomonadota bacterium]